MARYIDAEKMVSKDNSYTTFPHDLAGCDDNDLVRWINEQPTADVVPKSEEDNSCDSCACKLLDERDDARREVDRLQAEKDALIKNYSKCMKDYAREIFEEITKIVYSKIPDKILPVTLKEMSRQLDYNDGLNFGSRNAYFDTLKIIAELRKKYVVRDDL